MSRSAAITANVAHRQVTDDALRIVAGYLGDPPIITEANEAVWPSEPGDARSPALVLSCDPDDPNFGLLYDEETGAECDVIAFVAERHGGLQSQDAALLLIEETLGRPLVGRCGRRPGPDVPVF